MGGAHLGIWKLYGVLHLKICHCKQERGGAEEAEGNDPGEAAPVTALSARARPMLPKQGIGHRAKHSANVLCFTSSTVRRKQQVRKAPICLSRPK